SPGFLVRNCSATGKRVIAESRLPVLGHDELCAVQELGIAQKSSGEIGATKNRLEEVCPLQVGAGQVRPVQLRASEIGALKINPGKIVSAQVEASQTGLAQIWHLAVFCAPRIPRRGTTSKHRNMLIIWHVPPSSSHPAVWSRCCNAPDRAAPASSLRRL